MQSWHKRDEHGDFANPHLREAWKEIQDSGKIWYHHQKADGNNPKFEEGEYVGCVASFEYNGSLYVGFAALHPNDNYNKKIGRRMALGRAQKALAVSLHAASASSQLRLSQVYHGGFEGRRPKMDLGYHESPNGDIHVETNPVLEPVGEPATA